MNALSRPVLPRGPYLLCDDTVLPDVPLPDKAARLLAGGARVLQLRMKRTSPREALA
ncbi:thiamine phosphate synthase, partial [Pyxidicoccus sp. 3LG]